MTKFRTGEAVLDITPTVGPWNGAPEQPVTSFGSAAGQMDIDLAGGSITMVTLGHAPEAKVISELVTDLWLLGDFPQRYRLWAVWQDFDEHGDDRISFQGVTYERLVNRRLFGAGGLRMVNEDVGTILWAALAHTQAKPGGDLGLTQGNTTTGVTYSVDWLPGDNIGARLQEMCDAHGLFWRVDENKAVHVYVRDEIEPITEPIMWGINARHMQRASGGYEFANSVFASGNADTTPVFATSPTIATDPRGLWESALSRPSFGSQDEVADAASGDLRLRSQGLARWNITFVNEHWIGASRLVPGDRAFLVPPPTLAGPPAPFPIRRVECISIQMSFTGDSGMEVRAVVQELPPIRVPVVFDDGVAASPLTVTYSGATVVREYP